MVNYLQISIILVVVTAITCFRLQQKFITFNSSSTKYVISTSIASNLDEEFAIYSPVLINTKDSSAQFTPSQVKKKWVIEPKFVQDHQLLYNDFHEGQYWYGFKKQIDPTKKDTTATFGLVTITHAQQPHHFFMPLFSLPLSFLSLQQLYKCDDVLISYKPAGNLIDITVFSQKQGWKLSPEATWGFRNMDDRVYFSRQTYPKGTTVQVNVGQGKFCELQESDLTGNKYNLQEKDVYRLNDLLIKYSKSLEVKDINDRQQNQQQLL